jgi:hypothetical protein
MKERIVDGMHPLMKVGGAIMAFAGVVVLVTALIGVWQTYPQDQAMMRIMLSALFVGVGGFAVFVVGYCIEMAR